MQIVMDKHGNDLVNSFTTKKQTNFSSANFQKM